MTSIYGPSQNDPFEQFKAHVKRNQELYIVGGFSLAIGLVLGKGRKAPKINEAAIITKWMEETAKSGYNIYALTNEQKALWEACWGWAEKEATRANVPLTELLKLMTRDYKDWHVRLAA